MRLLVVVVAAEPVELVDVGAAGEGPPVHVVDLEAVVDGAAPGDGAVDAASLEGGALVGGGCPAEVGDGA